jgi:hypothetical protein
VQAVLEVGINVEELYHVLQKMIDDALQPSPQDGRHDVLTAENGTEYVSRPDSGGHASVPNSMAPFLHMLSEWLYIFRSELIDLTFEWHIPIALLYVVPYQSTHFVG